MADSSTFEAWQAAPDTQEIAVKPNNAFFIAMLSVALMVFALVIVAAVSGVPMHGYQAPEPRPAPVATPY